MLLTNNLPTYIKNCGLGNSKLAIVKEGLSTKTS
jgi:hypothetical protein